MNRVIGTEEAGLQVTVTTTFLPLFQLLSSDLFHGNHMAIAQSTLPDD